MFKKYIPILSIQSYSFFIISMFFSTIGGGFLSVAMSWFVASINESIREQAILMICLFSTQFLLSPIFGYLSDHYNKKKLLTASRLLRLIVLLLYFILFNDIPAYSIFIVALFLAISVSINRTTAFTFVKDIIPTNLLLHANIFMDIIYGLGIVLGMSLGGLFIAQFPMRNAFLVVAFFTIISIFFNAKIKYQPANSALLKLNIFSIKKSYLKTYIYIKNDQKLFLFYIIQIVLMVSIATTPMLLPIFAKKILHTTAKKFGYLESVAALGYMLSSLCISIFLNKKYVKYLLITMSLLLSIVLSLFACINSMYFAYIIYGFIGFFTAIFILIVSQTQLLTHHQYQGKLQSICFGIEGLITLFIYLLTSFWGDLINIRLFYFMESLLVIFSTILFIYFYKLLYK